MKLIDADKLIEDLEGKKKELLKQLEYDLTEHQSIVFDVQINRINLIIEIINSQPTAYDLDKVVEQLQVLSENYFKRYCECMEQKDKEMALKYSLKFCSYDDAIEIVKAGEIDESQRIN